MSSSEASQPRAGGGYFRCINAIFDFPISLQAKAVFINLSRRANRKGESFPSHATIARDCSCSERTVQRALNELAEHQLIKITSRKDQGNSNFYVIRALFLLATKRERGTTDSHTPTTDSRRGVRHTDVLSKTQLSKTERRKQNPFSLQKDEPPPVHINGNLASNLKYDSELKAMLNRVAKKEKSAHSEETPR